MKKELSTKQIDRNCWDHKPHDPHTWRSLIVDSHAKEDNCKCDGTGKAPELWKSNYTPKVKKDYSEDPDFPVDNPITVEQARKIAHHMHKDQLDKAGEPYFHHLNAVQMGVVVLGGTIEEQVAALFHDAVEDHHTTYELLRKISLTEHTITTIEAVSKRSNEKQSDYLARIIKTESAMRVKLADLMHNTRHDRMKELPEHTQKRLKEKYQPAMAKIMIELGMIIDKDKKLETVPKGTGGYTSTQWQPTSHKPKAKKTPDPTTWNASSLARGDWVIDWEAPVLHRIHMGKEVRLILTNGRVLDLKATARLKAYTRNAWETNTDIQFAPYGNPVSEDIISDYIDVLEEARNR